MKIKYNFKPGNIYITRFKSGDLVLTISEEEEPLLQHFLKIHGIKWINNNQMSLRQYGNELACLRKDLCIKSRKKEYANLNWIKPKHAGCLIFAGVQTGYHQYYTTTKRMATTEFLNNVKNEDKV